MLEETLRNYCKKMSKKSLNYIFLKTLFLMLLKLSIYYFPVDLFDFLILFLLTATLTSQTQTVSQKLSDTSHHFSKNIVTNHLHCVMVLNINNSQRDSLRLKCADSKPLSIFLYLKFRHLAVLTVR